MSSLLMKLRQKKAGLVKEGGAILAKAEGNETGLTAEDTKRLDEIEAGCKSLDEQIARAEAQVERERSMGAAAFASVAADPMGLAPGLDLGKNASPKPFKTFGEQLIAIAKAAQGGGVDPRLSAIQAAATGASEGTPADGGFLVQQDFAAPIFASVMSGGAIASRVRRIPISTNASGIKIPSVNETSRADGSRWGAIRAYWAAEAASMTGSRPKFRMIEMNLNKLTGLFYATDELLADAAALEAVARLGFTEEMTFKTEDAIIRGTGAGMPLGLLNADCVVSQAKETGQAAATIVYQNIIKMWARLHARNRPNAVWLINQEIETQLFQMYLAVGTGGVPVYLPANGASASPYGTLMGRPVIPVEYCAALGTVGDIILADFGEYLMIEKGGAEWASSMHVQFTTGEQVFRMVMRLDGQPTLASAITPFKGGSTLSPFVTLATRA